MRPAHTARVKWYNAPEIMGSARGRLVTEYFLNIAHELRERAGFR